MELIEWLTFGLTDLIKAVIWIIPLIVGVVMIRRVAKDRNISSYQALR
jgi:hypothetical protein